jgi:hypothetical protein
MLQITWALFRQLAQLYIRPMYQPQPPDGLRRVPCRELSRVLALKKKKLSRVLAHRLPNITGQSEDTAKQTRLYLREHHLRAN